MTPDRTFRTVRTVGASWNNPFEPPGPGTWLLDANHFTRASTAFYAETWTAPAEAGFAAAARHHGVLLGDLAFVHVNGFVYARLCTLDEAGKPRPLATAAELQAVLASDAELRQRAIAAEETLRDRGWRADLRRWDEHDKPGLLAGHRALLAIDPAALDRESLLRHIGDCREHLIHAVYAHHRYTIPSLLPVGDLVAHVEEWTGRPAVTVFQLLRGSSSVSLGATDELRAAADAIRIDPAARAVLDADSDAAACLARLRRLPGTTRRAIAVYLDLVGHRPVNGHDIGEPTALEVPQLPLRALREAVDGTAAARRQANDDQLAELRAEIPATRRGDFDVLLGEARRINRFRDERDLLADGTAEGVTRRAILAAGRVLAPTGAIEEPAHLAEATFAEMRSLLIGPSDGGATSATAPPSPGELADRAAYARAVVPATAPPFLGPPPGPPIDPTWLPPAMARVQRAVSAGLDAIFGRPPEPAASSNGVMRGIGTGGGTYVGPARVLRVTADFARLRPGDVLVAPGTSPAFNVVLPLIAAVVTDSGGLLSHAAIVAREAGLPGVVGCGDATARIPDGAVVRVDGDTGEVTIHGRQAPR
jgi:pyruvate,water dikinase